MDMKKSVFVMFLLAVCFAKAQVPRPAPMDTIMYDEREVTYFYYDNWDFCRDQYGYIWFYAIGEEPWAWQWYTDSTLRVCGIAICAIPLFLSEGYIDSNFSADPQIHTDSFIRVHIYEAGSGTLVTQANAIANINTVSRYIQTYGWEHTTDWSFHQYNVYGRHYKVYPVTEVYFDSTVTVSDSFYIGLSSVHPAPQTGLYPGKTIIGVLEYSCCAPEIYIDPQSYCFRTYGSTTTMYYEQQFASFDLNTERWGYSTGTLIGLPLIFPIIDSTGWYLYCDTMVCPRIKDLIVSVSEGMAVCSWLGDTLDGHSQWQLSYGPAGTEPGGGRVITTSAQSQVLSGLNDTMLYVAYVRGYCDECGKWGEWSPGMGFRLRVPEREGCAGVPEGSVSLQPNPARGVVNVVSSFRLSRIEVYSLDGRKVLEQEADGISTVVDVSGLSSGKYIAALYLPHGVATKKLVVE